MRILALVALFALLTGPANAQGMNLLGDTPKDQIKEEKRQENERAYNAARQRIPDQKVIAVDPWGNMRSTPEAKTITAKPKTPAR